MAVVAELVSSGGEFGLPYMPLKKLVNGCAINLDGCLFQTVIKRDRPAVV